MNHSNEWEEQFNEMVSKDPSAGSGGFYVGVSTMRNFIRMTIATERQKGFEKGFDKDARNEVLDELLAELPEAKGVFPLKDLKYNPALSAIRSLLESKKL